MEDEGLGLGDYVALRIGQIFDDLAKELGRMDLPEEVAAGVPMTLFRAEMYLKGAWLHYIKGDVEEFRRLVKEEMEGS
jgi:hypothetical protein